jgi:type IV pilus assembly protein PilQ
MIIEVSNSNSVSTGLDLGLGEAPNADSGSLFAGTDLTLGATSINKIIGGFNGFGSLNLGKVVPNFYARIQALETNGDLKVRSTPKLSTLNGHQATLSKGERSYYAVTRRDVIGSQNPQTTEIKNYFPIDADLSIGIRPIVSGDGNITLS